MAHLFYFNDYHMVENDTRRRTIPVVPSDNYQGRAIAGDPISLIEMRSRLWVVWSRLFPHPIGGNTKVMDEFLQIDSTGPISASVTREIRDDVGIHFLPILMRSDLPQEARLPVREGRQSVHHWNYWSAAFVTSMHPDHVFVVECTVNAEINARMSEAVAAVSWTTALSEANYRSRRRQVMTIPYNLPRDGTDGIPELSGWSVVNAFAELLLNFTPVFENPAIRIPFADYISIAKLKKCMSQHFISYEAWMRAGRRAARNANGQDDDAREREAAIEEAEVEAAVEEAMAEYARNTCFCCNRKFPPGWEQRDPNNLLNRCAICQLSFHQHCRVDGELCLREHVACGHQIWLCYRCQSTTPGFQPRRMPRNAHRNAASQREGRQQQQRQQRLHHGDDDDDRRCDHCDDPIIRGTDSYIPCHAEECPKVYHTHCAMKTEGWRDDEIRHRKRVVESPRNMLLNKKDRSTEEYYDTQFRCPQCRAKRMDEWVLNRMPQPEIQIWDYKDEGGLTTCDRCGYGQLFRWELQSNNRLCCGTPGNPVHFATEQHAIPPSILELHRRNPKVLAQYSRLINSMVAIASVACLQLVNVGNNQLATRVMGGISQHLNATTLTPEGHQEAVGVIGHFGISDRGPRNNPLIGNVLSYIFPEPSTKEIASLSIQIDGQPVQVPSCTVGFIQQSRHIFRHYNPFFQQVMSMVDAPTTMTEAHNFQERSVVGHLGPHYVERGAMPAVAWDATAFRFEDTIAMNTTAVAFSIENNTSFRPITAGRLGGTNIVHFDHNNPWYDAFVYPLLHLYGRTSYCAGKNIGPEIFHSKGETLYQPYRPHTPISWIKHLRSKVMQLQMFRLCPDATDQLVLDRISMHYQIDARSREFFVRRSGFQAAATEERPTRTVYDPIRHLHKVHHTVRGSMQERSYHVEQGAALVEHLGHPTLFITITANENWPEFRRAMIPGTKWWQNMGLLVRVFKRKLDILVEGLHSGKYFGRKAIWVQYKIEFQKRGKPHAHILARLEGCEHLLPEEVDQMVSAELPRCPDVESYENPNSDCGQRGCKLCKLRKQVQLYMTHNHRPDRCSKKKPKRKNDTEPDAIIEDHERCELGYPFPPQHETTFGAAGRWLYKRSPVSGWIVPYSPVLISEFDCHINVEVSTGTRCVYYLQKYFAKVHDTVCAKVDFKPGATERAQLTQFFQLRYLCIAEAYWQLFGYPFVYFSPKVTSIYVNPNPKPSILEQLELYDPGPENEGEAGPPVETGLTRDLQLYFNRPYKYQNITIVDFYSNFSVRKLTRAEVDEGLHPENLIGSYSEFRLVKRQETHVVCFRYRNARDMERFSFILLLRDIPARSKSELKTVEGELLPTYEQACKKKGLVDEDAAGMYRRLFFELDLHQHPLETFLVAAKGFLLDNPALFFDFFENQRMYRFLLKHGERNFVARGTEDDARLEADLFDLALAHLARYCYSENILLREMIEKVDPNHPLGPKLDRVLAQNLRMELLRTQFRHARVPEHARVSDTVLTDEQCFILQQIKGHFEEWRRSKAQAPTGALHHDWWKSIHYINGMAGTGKTTLLRSIIDFFAERDYAIAASAYTGIASLELPKARTCHSLYGIPIRLDESKLPQAENIDLGFEDHEAQLRRGVLNLGDVDLMRMEVLGTIRIHIIDEVSLVSRVQLQYINETLRQAARHAGLPDAEEPFGGAFVILAGDFHQTVPILNKPPVQARHNDKLMNSLVVNETILSHDLFKSRHNPDEPAIEQVASHQLCDPQRFRGSSTHAFNVFATAVAKGEAGRNFDPDKEEDSAHFSIPITSMPACFHRSIYYTLNDAVRNLPPDRRNDALQLMAPHHRAVQKFNATTIKENVEKGRLGELKYSSSTYCDVKQLHQDKYYDPGMIPGVMQFEAVDQPRDPPHCLELAVGMPIILLRNMSIEDGMTNGAIYTIVEVNQTYIRARSHRNPNVTQCIWRMRLTMSCGIWDFKRLQYPVRPAYGITINKSQGKTLEGPTILYLQEDCFAHGQLYVALTRLRYPEELILVVKPRRRLEDVSITNYVLRDVLARAGLLQTPE